MIEAGPVTALADGVPVSIAWRDASPAWSSVTARQCRTLGVSVQCDLDSSVTRASAPIGALTIHVSRSIHLASGPVDCTVQRCHLQLAWDVDPTAGDFDATRAVSFDLDFTDPGDGYIAPQPGTRMTQTLTWTTPAAVPSTTVPSTTTSSTTAPSTTAPSTATPSTAGPTTIAGPTTNGPVVLNGAALPGVRVRGARVSGAPAATKASDVPAVATTVRPGPAAIAQPPGAIPRAIPAALGGAGGSAAVGPQTLAFTGNRTLGLVAASSVIIGLGLALISIPRRRHA